MKTKNTKSKCLATQVTKFYFDKGNATSIQYFWFNLADISSKSVSSNNLFTLTLGILLLTGRGKSARSFSSMYFQTALRMAGLVTSSAISKYNSDSKQKM